jgi:hypothetical protein
MMEQSKGKMERYNKLGIKYQLMVTITTDKSLDLITT